MQLLLSLGIAYPDADYRKDAGCFQSGRLVVVDWSSKNVVRSIDYQPLPENRPDVAMDNVNFKGGALRDDRLFVTTNTEIAEFVLPTFEIAGRYSHPYLNDCHFVHPAPDSLWVVVTGLDLVVRFSYEMEVLEEFETGDVSPWSKFDRSLDFRKVVSTKPHAVHPNCVFFPEGDPWATRFQQKDAVSLPDRSRRIPVDVGNPHDGCLREGSIYFTTTNGFVVAADIATKKVKEAIDLNSISDQDHYLGWCRGIEVVDNRAYVGFTTLRPTKWKGMASWVKNMGRDPLPSRIVEYDLRKREMISEYILPKDPQHAIYMVRRLPDHLQV